MRAKFFVNLAVVTFLVMGVLAVQNRFLLGLSSVRPGMPESEVSKHIGTAEFFGPGLDDQWHFVRFGPLIVYAFDVKIRNEMALASDGAGHIVDPTHTLSVTGKRVLCFNREYATKE